MYYNHILFYSITFLMLTNHCLSQWWLRDYGERDLGVFKPRTPKPILRRIPDLVWRSAKDTWSDIKMIAKNAKEVSSNAVDLAQDLPVIDQIKSKLVKDKNV